MYRRSALSQAADKLRAQFVDEILRLEEGSLDVPRVLTDEAYTKHLKAKIEFESYLGAVERKTFAEAWTRCFEYQGFFIGQNVAPGRIDDRKNEIPKAPEIIQDLLFYAKHE